MLRRTWIAGALAASAAAADSRWTVVRRRSGQETLVDLACGEGALALAAQPKGLLSLDGGRTFLLTEMPEGVASVHVVNANTIWAAGAKGLHQTTDAGGSWTPRLEQEGLRRVYFLNESRGFACGEGRTILETSDGGAKWKRTPAADEPNTSAAYTTYNWIHFVTPRAGIITGSSRPPRQGVTNDLPAWRDPAAELRRKEWPGASITLETRDGGVTWKHATTSLFGQITRVRYSRDGYGLSLVEFHDAFEWPSEVFLINIRTGESKRTFREANRAVTDVIVYSASEAYLAAIAPPVNPSESNLGTLHVLQSRDLENWTEMELPEQIAAGRAMFAPAPDGSLWLGTDTGFVLHLPA